MKNWIAMIIAAVGLVVFGALLVLEAVSFRRTVADLAESETRVTVVNADGSVHYDTLSASDNHAMREEIKAAFENGKAVSKRESETQGKTLLYAARKVGDRVVRLAVPYDGVLESERMARNILLTAAVTGGIVILLVFLVTRRLSRRLEEQTRALASARENEAFRREFTANVTHELRTPLTAILGSVEMLGDGTGLSDEERKELFGIVKEQAGRLNSLSSDVLALAQLEREQGEPRWEFAPVALDELVDRVAQLERPRLKANGMALTVACKDAVTMPGDARLLEQALVNLVENAIRYSGSDSVELSVSRGDGAVTLAVTDHGVGIAAEHLPRLFERFYRVDKARSRSLGGTGLGLAIVKHIALLHGGEVAVASVPGERTVFSLTFPCRPRTLPNGNAEAR